MSDTNVYPGLNLGQGTERLTTVRKPRYSASGFS